ncbi:MAG: glycosyltransferase family 2 protein [Sphingobacteriaceae bacterium]|nr:MAG: glycosyltransferase family 2 protein [Sphingobacteriaceae bacterium]
MLNSPTIIDIIILSYAKNQSLKNLTEQTIRTLISSENPAIIKFNIVVIESEKSLYPFQFEQTETIYPSTTFSFNKYLNIGIRHTSGKFLCLCNNDLIFKPNWATQILKALQQDQAVLSANPYCTNYHQTKGFEAKGNPIEGYFGVFTGWCVFIKREIFDIIGPLDENLNFWYCDNDYLQLLLKHKIKNVLVPTSVITHLGSKSLEESDQKTFNKLTLLPQIYYNYKWNHHSLFRYKIEKALLRLKLCITKPLF